MNSEKWSKILKTLKFVILPFTYYANGKRMCVYFLIESIAASARTPAIKNKTT